MIFDIFPRHVRVFFSVCLTVFLQRTQFVLCPICLPNPKKSLTPDSLLRDAEFQELLLRFEVLELDVFQSLGVAEVAVLSKETRINVCFKQLARKPFPKAVKLRKLLQAFPRVHRMPFREYGGEGDWLRDLQKKCAEISSFYLNARALDLHDNFDLMVERTPLHERTSNRSRRPNFANDSYRMRFPTSQEEMHNISTNSLRSTGTNRTNVASDTYAISSQSVELPHESESFNISSQSFERNSSPLPSTESPRAATPDSLNSSGGNTIINMLPSVRNVRNTVTPNSPQPGPSGLQRSAFAVPTRRPEVI